MRKIRPTTAEAAAWERVCLAYQYAVDCHGGIHAAAISFP